MVNKDFHKQRSLTSTGTAFLATELLMCGITYHMMQLISPQYKKVQILIDTVRFIEIFTI